MLGFMAMIIISDEQWPMNILISIRPRIELMSYFMVAVFIIKVLAPLTHCLALNG